MLNISEPHPGTPLAVVSLATTMLSSSPGGDEMSDERLIRIETALADLRTGQDELGRQMRVLHEETLDRIAALAPDDAPLRRDFARANAELREDIARRLEPLEAWARSKRDPIQGP